MALLGSRVGVLAVRTRGEALGCAVLEEVIDGRGLATVALIVGASETGGTPGCTVCTLESAGVAVLSSGTGDSAGRDIEEVGGTVKTLAALTGAVGRARGTNRVTGGALVVC